MNLLKILLNLILITIHFARSTSKVHKLIYEKDLSEHCRRRVVPSMFLGRQVVEANARILQLSRLELPYSCFISVRTESGSNIVMMIELREAELDSSCSKQSEQLMVYEIGETFGGYWGPLPDSVMKREPMHQRSYTLKTPLVTTTTTESSTIEEESEEEEEETTELTSTKTSDSPTGDYIEVEIPLLNVSVHMEQMDKALQTEPLDLEAAFNGAYDVTPIVGVPYDRSILPLVQFHMIEQPGPGGPRSGDDDAPKYELDIVEKFTPDMRLIMPQINPTVKRRKGYKRRYQATRRLNFNKNRSMLDVQGYLDRQKHIFTRRMKEFTKYVFPTTKLPKSNTTYTQDSWQIIEELMKKLDKTKDYREITTLPELDTILLEKISNTNHKQSIYLSPNPAIYSGDIVDKVKPMNRKNAINLTQKPKLPGISIKAGYNYDDENPVTLTDTISTNTKIVSSTADASKIITKINESSTDSSDIEDIKLDQKLLTLVFHGHQSTKSLNASENNNETESSTLYIEPTIFNEAINRDLVHPENNKKAVVTGSMVGHESWENVVQAAPEMAVLLNQTVDYITLSNNSNNFTKESKDTIINNKLSRKKREIHSISIDNGRPHDMTTREQHSTTTRSTFEIAEMQEFAQLVELQDDELHGRVALRYLRQYVGPSLFNLCDLEENTKGHVHMFNSSRIVLAVTNFTMKRMIIILTAARTLLSGETCCPKAQLECQVSGARVCLDSMVACDGVPNCGSYDIYDEDRLLCGQAGGTQHNVYLAAFTFLVLLLTMVYAVHYWLSRFVPRVADAFFVYTNGVENVLYLDSIMRSPHDSDDASKLIFQSHLDDENLYGDTGISQKSKWHTFLQKCCVCFRKKQEKKSKKELEVPNLLLSKRMYSFTELEISKMISSSKETAVQTGDSLEMNFLQNIQNNSLEPAAIMQGHKNKTGFNGNPLMIRKSLITLTEPLPEKHKDELSLLKFFNGARAHTNGSNSNKLKFKKKDVENISSDMTTEEEITCHAYDHKSQSHPGPSKKRIKKVSQTSAASKHLRFEEGATTIPPGEYDVEDEDEVNHHRRNVVLGESRPSKRGNWLLDTIEESDEHSNAAGKEHRHFWTTNKSKKPKKKTQVLLR